ncbi:MAG: ligase-associated DNA damage response endonuclease PdeM [Bacteroidia bacterium]
MNQDFFLTIQDELFYLLPQKAIFWENPKALLISDLHLGKATHFSKNGIGLPANGSKQDLIKLEELISSYNANTVFFLGDLFHSNLNSEWNWFKTFVMEHKYVKFILLKGNHDIIPVKFFEEIKVEVLNAYKFKNILLSHEPISANNTFCISGHIHPGVVLKGKGKQKLKLPCFYITEKLCVMPAFGSLTGLEIVYPKEGEKIYAIANNSLIEYKN